jgi:hypothetical protein
MQYHNNTIPAKRQGNGNLDLIQPGSQGWENPQPNPEVLHLIERNTQQTAKAADRIHNLQTSTKLTTEQVHQYLQIPIKVLSKCRIKQALMLESEGLILAHVKRNGWLIGRIDPVSLNTQ